MRFAVVADIHGNLEAFERVLGDARGQGCSHYVCLGDVVGYNANPKECLDMVRGLGIPCVKGNHDEYCSVEDGLEWFNPAAAAAIRWTREQLSGEDREWLSGLRYKRLVANFSVVHATLDGPERWGYVFEKEDAAASFTYQNTSVCFFGHTHVPLAFVRDSARGDGVRGGTYSRFHVEPGRKYFVNVGSVGQSRDGVAKATYVVYDVEGGVIELRRLDYDMELTMRKIREAGLPERLAERLPLGR